MRTDQYSPNNLDPFKMRHEMVFYMGLNEDMFDPDEYKMVTDLYNKHGFKGGNFDTKGTCDHCGARFLWGSLFENTESGEVIAVGHVCASNFLAGTSCLKTAEQKMAAFKKACKTKAIRARVRREACEWLESECPSELIEAFFAAETGVWNSGFTNNVFHQLMTRGALSDKQIAAVIKAYQGWQEFAARKGEEVKIECPEGVVEVLGTVIKTDWLTNNYGTRDVMTVKDDRGFLVWGTIPTALWEECVKLKGARVAFTANVTRSDKDECFGFFKRPRKAALLAVNVANQDCEGLVTVARMD